MIDYILDILLQAAVMLPPFGVLYGLSSLRLKKKGAKIPVGHTVWTCLLFCFLIGLFSITGTLKLSDVLRGLTFDAGSINFTPLRSLSAGFVLNILIFLPIGFMLPLLFNGFHRFTKTFAAGFLLSLAIEVSQLFKHRTTDVDDLIANTLGAVLGWVLFRLVIKRPPQRLQISGGGALAQHEGARVIATAFILSFLLYPLHIKLVEWLFFQ